MRKKITVVGAGNVGASVAARLAEKGTFDVVLVDVIEGMPQGKALDLSQVGPVAGSDASITGANDYGPTAGSDLFIVTAGIARKPGMSRDDLLKTNTGIVKAVAEQIKKTSPNAFVIVVSNPLDAMCYVMKQVTGFPRERVIGMAGVLDSSRMADFYRAGTQGVRQERERLCHGRPWRHDGPDAALHHRGRGSPAGAPFQRQDRRDRETHRQRRRRDRSAA